MCDQNIQNIEKFTNRQKEIAYSIKDLAELEENHWLWLSDGVEGKYCRLHSIQDDEIYLSYNCDVICIPKNTYGLTALLFEDKRMEKKPVYQYKRQQFLDDLELKTREIFSSLSQKSKGSDDTKILGIKDSLNTFYRAVLLTVQQEFLTEYKLGGDIVFNLLEGKVKYDINKEVGIFVPSDQLKKLLKNSESKETGVLLSREINRFVKILQEAYVDLGGD